MPQAPAHGLQARDGPVDFVRLCGKHLPVETRPAGRREHRTYLVEREARRSRKGDERQLLEHARREAAPQTVAADRGDQPFLLVEAQRGRCHAGALRDLRNIHGCTLDFKWT